MALKSRCTGDKSATRYCSSCVPRSARARGTTATANTVARMSKATSSEVPAPSAKCRSRSGNEPTLGAPGHSSTSRALSVRACSATRVP